MERQYQLGLYEKAMPKDLSWMEKLQAAKAGGFDFVEMSIDETDEKLARLDMTKDECLDMIRLMVQTGMPVRSMCLSGHRRFPMGSHDRAQRERSMEIMEKALRLADRLGIRMIQLAGYDVYYEQGDEETRKYFLENLSRAAGMAAKYGVIMGFETMETEFMNTVEKAMDYVHKVRSPYLNVYPDVGNLTNAAKMYGRDERDDLMCGTSHLIAVHLKETRPGVFRDMHFGEGHVNFEKVIKTSWDLGVRRYVTEFWYKGEEQWADELVVACKKMRRILDRQELAG